MYVLSLPAVYTLELTPACNNRCPGCSNVYAQNRSPAPNPASAWIAWISAIAPEAVRIRLTGGEPTLHPQFFHIFDSALSYDARVTVFTNARWREPQFTVQQFSRAGSNFAGLLISLHGVHAESHEAFTRAPGSFAETLANLRLALDNGVPAAISCVLTRQNLAEIEALAELGQELGVQHVAFNRYLGGPLPGIELRRSEMRQAVSRIEKLISVGAPVEYGETLPQCFAINQSQGCLAGVAYASIDPWGGVHPCALSPTIAGSLRQASIAEIWHGAVMQDWRRETTPAPCSQCAAYGDCHGGCRAVQELHPDRRDPLYCGPLAEYVPQVEARVLPADGRPRARFRMRPEAFGYVLLAGGNFIPVAAGALDLLEACDGSATFAELAQCYGDAGLELLADLVQEGMLEIY
jgi:radical SAM protein with 4Fe4S-binding SPASM domain